ncbi:MAG: response regulator transcription factor [Lachnospiraceae bacterium]|nr:response regulator transcription factor [Lachnospiraceae bacterium]
MINVIVIDDHIMLRDMICDTLTREKDFKVIGTSSDAKDAVKLCDELSPDMVLMDICTENNSSGIAYGKKVKEKYPKIKVIAMTGVLDINFINDAKEAEIDSFVYKNISKDSLISTLRNTMDGYSLYPNINVNPTSQKNLLTLLSDKELEVLTSYCKHLDRELVADELGISTSTLKSHVSSIYQKTGFDNLTKLAIHCISNGFIVPNLEEE